MQVSFIKTNYRLDRDVNLTQKRFELIRDFAVFFNEYVEKVEFTENQFGFSFTVKPGVTKEEIVLMRNMINGALNMDIHMTLSEDALELEDYKIKLPAQT